METFMHRLIPCVWPSQIFLVFGFHPEVGLSTLAQDPLFATILLVSLAVVPTFGNFFPSKASFGMMGACGEGKAK